MTLRDTGRVWGGPTRYTTDSDIGTVAYMLLAKLKGCSFANAEVNRQTKVYIKTQSLGRLNNFASETICGKTSHAWTSSWIGVRIAHLRFFDESSIPNIREAVYNDTTGQIEVVEAGGGQPPPPVQKPDLVVEQLTVSKSTLTPGENFTLSVTVKNQEVGSAAATTLRYYRSTDVTISTSDTEVATDSVTGLDAEVSGAASITLIAPMSPGTYYYGACIDAVADESSSDNNCSDAVSITVQQPTLSTSTASPLIETTLDESDVTLTLTAATYEQNVSNISNAVTVSGIDGITVDKVSRRSDTEIAVDLAFDGTDFDADATLIFTIGADAIANYTGTELTAQVSVMASKESLAASTKSPLTADTLDGSVVTLTLSGRTFSPPIPWSNR